MTPNTKVLGYMSEYEADTTLKTNINNIRTLTEQALHEMDLLLPRIIFETDEELNKWKAIRQALIDFRQIAVTPYQLSGRADQRETD